MPEYTYQTIQSPATGVYREKGSKFLAFAYPVTSETDIRERIDALKKEYFDARHHCYAWVLGPEKDRFRAFDDGEPNHSAGDPILGRIRSKNLTNVLVVVVRYFGGVKLGVGGLINAYQTATEDALNNSVIVTREVREPLQIRYDYASTPSVMQLVKHFDLSFVDQQFGEDCVLMAEVRLKDKEALLEKISQLQAMGTPLQLD